MLRWTIYRIIKGLAASALFILLAGQLVTAASIVIDDVLLRPADSTVVYGSPLLYPGQ
jgi:hypothetical protein